MLLQKYLTSFGRYLVLMGRTFGRPDRLRMFMKQYVKEMSALGVNSIGIVDAALRDGIRDEGNHVA